MATLLALSVFHLNAIQASMLFLLIAGLLWKVGKQPGIPLPPVAFIIIAYSLAYPLPILLSNLYPILSVQISANAQEYALLWAVRGFGAFALGYALVERFGKHVGKQNWRDENIFKARRQYMVYIITWIGWLAMLSWFASVMIFGISLVFIEGKVVVVDTAGGTLLQVFTLLSNLRYPFFLGFLLLYYWKQTNRNLRILFAALLFISIIEIITIGSKGSIVRLLVLSLLVLGFISTRLSIKQIITGILALVLIYGSFVVITEYRVIMHTKNRTHIDVFDLTIQVESFKTAFLLSLPFSENSGKRQSKVDSYSSLSRFGAGMYSFANLMEFTRRQPPYEHAWESFWVPIYSVTPRFLIPEKPVFFDSGQNAKKYYNWRYGGISVTLLGSFYYTWGYTGIIFGMAFFGGLLAYMMRRWRQFGVYSARWLVLLVLMILPLMDVGVTFQAIIINLIRVSILLGLLHFLCPLVRGSMRRRISGTLMPQVHGRR